MSVSADRESMQARVDDVDLQLIHALQEFPRISWTAAGRVLGLSPTTVASRWRRLEAEGWAWISVHPNVVAPDYLTAIVELGILPSGRAAIADRLVRDGRIVSVDESSRGSDLLLTVIVSDLPTLSRFVLDDLTPNNEITSIRTSVVVGVFGSGGDWRAGTLDADQVALLRRVKNQTGSASPDPGPAGEHLPPDSWAITRELMRNGRMSVADVARAVDRNPATVRRHLASLLTARRLSFRCDMTHELLGLPVTATFFARVPPTELHQTTERLHRVPRLRMGLQVTGESNLIFSVLTRSVYDVAALHQQMGRLFPNMEVVESMVLLRSRKRMGWLLDESGRRTGELVPPSVLESALRGPGPDAAQPGARST